MTSLPKIVIIGAYKCGTTSLFEWLGSHPQCVTSYVKEPNFLRDEPDLISMKVGKSTSLSYHRDGLDAYRHCWPSLKEGEVALEATPFYLYFDTPVDVLSRLANPPVVVVVVRDPVARVRSIFLSAKYKNERIPQSMDFDAFVDHLLGGRADVDLRGRPQLERALEHSHYSRYLANWSNYPGEFKVVQFERAIQMPDETSASILRDAGVDVAADWKPRSRPENPTVDLRGSHTAKMVRKAKRYLHGAPMPVVAAATRLRRPARYLEYATRRRSVARELEPQDALDRGTASLLEYFAAERRVMSTDFGIDATLWST